MDFSLKSTAPVFLSKLDSFGWLEAHPIEYPNQTEGEEINLQDFQGEITPTMISGIIFCGNEFDSIYDSESSTMTATASPQSSPLISSAALGLEFVNYQLDLQSQEQYPPRSTEIAEEKTIIKKRKKSLKKRNHDNIFVIETLESLKEKSAKTLKQETTPKISSRTLLTPSLPVSNIKDMTTSITSTSSTQSHPEQTTDIGYSSSDFSSRQPNTISELAQQQQQQQQNNGLYEEHPAGKKEEPVQVFEFIPEVHFESKLTNFKSKSFERKKKRICQDQTEDCTQKIYRSGDEAEFADEQMDQASRFSSSSFVPNAHTDYEDEERCHSSSHQSNQRPDAAINNNPSSKGFPCLHDGCAKVFKRYEHLKRHVLMHTGEKPYVCDICRKKFSRSDNLSQHLRVHKKEDSEAAQEPKKKKPLRTHAISF